MTRLLLHRSDFALDMKEGRIGTLGSDGAVLEQLKERLPRKVWTFVTPKGRKDRLQLVGSFLITESKPVSFVPNGNTTCSTMPRLLDRSFTPTRTALKKLMR